MVGVCQSSSREKRPRRALALHSRFAMETSFASRSTLFSLAFLSKVESGVLTALTFEFPFFCALLFLALALADLDALLGTGEGVVKPTVAILPSLSRVVGRPASVVLCASACFTLSAKARPRSSLSAGAPRTCLALRRSPGLACVALLYDDRAAKSSGNFEFKPANSGDLYEDPKLIRGEPAMPRVPFFLSRKKMEPWALPAHP